MYYETLVQIILSASLRMLKSTAQVKLDLSVPEHLIWLEGQGQGQMWLETHPEPVTKTFCLFKFDCEICNCICQALWPMIDIDQTVMQSC